MNDVGIFNNSNKDINLKEINDFAKYLIEYMKVNNVNFNVIFVNNDEIRNINKNYRNIDRETDVISFALEDDKLIKNNSIRVLGDIYISIDKAISQAKEYNHSIKREVYFLTTHGFLHLLGYDHMNKEDEEVMFKLQEEILSNYGIKR